MTILFVVSDPRDWPLSIPGVDVVAARDYLTDRKYSDARGVKVFNLCRSYRYQKSGYYVSLLASARGHRPIPDVDTLQNFKTQSLFRVLSADLSREITASLRDIQSDSFTLSIYFGRNLAKRHERLSLTLFNHFKAPLLRARFERRTEGWELRSIRPIEPAEIPPEHHEAVLQFAVRYFEGRSPGTRRQSRPRYDLAILHDPEERDAPSNPLALRRFEMAARRAGFAIRFLTRDDYARLPEFDALFIRETTRVNHHTFRFAQRAAAEGLVVIDDPQSIIRCGNKVYLAELLSRHRISTPHTIIVHRGNLAQAMDRLSLPCVLKKPDSAFSQGVTKVDDAREFQDRIRNMLEESDLVVAQEFVPTEFDWRVGILDGSPLYVSKYHMARNHWQVVRRDAGGGESWGKDTCLRVEEAPPRVIRAAVRAARLIGNGLYGVDVKEHGRRVLVMEVNDNPNIDAGVEDRILGKRLYELIAGNLMQRVELQKARS